MYKRSLSHARTYYNVMKGDIYLTLTHIKCTAFGFLKRNYKELLILFVLLLPVPVFLGVIIGIKETAAEEYLDFLLKVARGEKKAFTRAFVVALSYSLSCVPFYFPAVRPFADKISWGIVGINALIFGIQTGAIFVENKPSGYLLFLLVLIPSTLLLSFCSICYILKHSLLVPCEYPSATGTALFIAANLTISFFFYLTILTCLKVFC